MNQISFDPIGGWITVGTVAAVLIGMLWLGPDRSKTSFRQRLVLSALRFFGIGVILLIMARPAIVVTQTTRQSALLVFLIDRSRSMQVADSLGADSRFETVRKMLADARPELAEIAALMSIKTYLFDSELTPVPTTAGQIDIDQVPTGEQSALGTAIEELLAREAGQRIVGIVLASDGAQRAFAPYDLPPSIAAGRAADLGIPLYTAVFGQPGSASQSRDVAVEELLVSPTVYVKNQLDINTTLRTRGYSGKQLVVQLMYEVEPGQMKGVAAQRFSPTAEGGPQPIRFTYVPESPGEHKITVQVAEQPGELVTTNNSSSTFVTVLQGGLNVLYLAGGYPREQRDVRWSLGASPDIQLVAHYFGSLPRDRESWPLELKDDMQPQRYDAVILGDIDARVFSKPTWQAIAAAVDNGTGLMMHGGFHSFGPGGFQDTALADVLPITMERLEGQNFDEPPSGDLHLAGPLRFRLASIPSGAQAILTLASPEENATLLAKLPPFDGANRFRGLKRNAVVLAEHDGQPPAPLLVAGTYGKGRVLASAVDSTYRWIEGGFDAAHRRFWRQAILWLAQKDEAGEGNVWIKLAGRRFRPNVQVSFTAGLSRTEESAGDAISYRADVVQPDGTREKITMSRTNDMMRGMASETSQAGEYAIEVTAMRGETPMGTARSRFLVFEQDLELDDPAANPALLASLAAQTSDLGGRAIVAEELPALLQELARNPPDLDLETETRQSSWDTWPVLLTFIALLSTEWYLRKRWGLV